MTIDSTRALMRPLTAAAATCAGLLLVVACASVAKTPAMTNAQLLAPPRDPCELAREDAALDPRLDVERVPSPVKMEPAPIRRPVPRSVLRRDGSSVIRIEVLVDTLGKPDMTTFAVLESSHAWFTNGAKAAIAKWTFEPATRGGCKVARYYQFSASSPPRKAR
jgi:outer membrane biosynthesis protein TonB